MRHGAAYTTGGVLLGIGAAGFIDGIVLHQVLQWHHLVSHTDGNGVDTLAGLERNVVADGLFHVAAWLATFIGLWLVLRALRDDRGPSPTAGLLGRMLIGFGAFNLVEGVIDHHLLGIHHVNETAPRSDWAAWDIGFLALMGLVPLALGALLIRRRARDVVSTPR